MFHQKQWMCWTAALSMTLLVSGCGGLMHRSGGCFGGSCSTGGCATGGCEIDDCGSCGKSKSKWYRLGRHKKCDDGCAECADGCEKSFGACSKCGVTGSLCGGCCGSCLATRSLAIPEVYPVGAVMRAHFHQMQTNAEASDFILYQKDFVLESAELTPDGRDKILEIAARMRSAPFPVIVERTWNNANPELDAHRRAIVSQILVDMGNTDANARTFVSTSYGLGKNGLEGIPEFYQYTFQGSRNNIGNTGNGFGGGF